MATWPVLSGADDAAFAQQNLLQTEKADRDGQIPMTGVFQPDMGATVTPAAGVLTLGNDGNYFAVAAGNFASIVQTAVGGAAVQAGTVNKLHFDGASLITHSANLYLPGAVNIQTAAGDELEFTCFGTNQWRCTKDAASPGTWTPVRLGFTEVPGGGSIVNTGTYIKFGRMAITNCLIQCSGGATIAATAGSSYLTGMPYAPATPVAGVWVNTAVPNEGGPMHYTGTYLVVCTSWAALVNGAYRITVVSWV